MMSNPHFATAPSWATAEAMLAFRPRPPSDTTDTIYRSANMIRSRIEATVWASTVAVALFAFLKRRLEQQMAGLLYRIVW